MTGSNPGIVTLNPGAAQNHIQLVSACRDRIMIVYENSCKH